MAKKAAIEAKKDSEALQEDLSVRRENILKRRGRERRKKLHIVEELLPEDQLDVLRHIDKTNEEIGVILGKTETWVEKRVARIRKQVSPKSRADLALWALEHGIEYTVPAPPSLEGFTLRERSVAAKLRHRNPDIEKSLKLTPWQVIDDVTSLMKKTGASNRTVLALIADIYYFKPFAEESKSEVHEALEQFNEDERKVLSRLHLTGTLIGAEIGKSASRVSQLILGAHNIIGLPIWLIITVIGISTLIGTLAGLYPAARAAKLDPVDALRYE